MGKSRDGQELTHKLKFRLNSGQSRVWESMFGKGTLPKHLPDFWPVQFGCSGQVIKLFGFVPYL